MAAALMLCVCSWGAAGDNAVAEPTVAVKMVAVQATADTPAGQDKEGAKSYDRAIDAATRKALEKRKLPFNTFRHLNSGDSSAPVGGEARFKIDGRYTLFVSPTARERDGRLQTKVRIESKNGSTTKDAVTIVFKAVPGEPLILAGLKLDEGELIVVLTLSERPASAKKAQPGTR